MTKVQSKSIRKKLLAVLLIAAVVIAFSPLAATTAHAASKFTLYKGQKIPVEFYASSKVSFKSSKAKIVQIKKGKKNKFTIVAKKAGKSTLTAKAKYYKTKKFTVTVKSSYPTGSIKKPIALTSSWKTIKSTNGKKQIKSKVTVWKGADARSRILALEQKPTDGSASFDISYYNNPTVTANRTLYLIKLDYNIVKGYPAGSGASLFGLLGGSTYYDKKWKQISATSYEDYYLLSNENYVSNAPDGSIGSYYVAVFMDNSIKEIRRNNVGYIEDVQSLGSFGKNYGLILSGCVSLKLP